MSRSHGRENRAPADAADLEGAYRCGIVVLERDRVFVMGEGTHVEGAEIFGIREIVVRGHCFPSFDS